MEIACRQRKITLIAYINLSILVFQLFYLNDKGVNVHQGWYVRFTVMVGSSDWLLSVRRTKGSIAQGRKNIHRLTTPLIKISLKLGLEHIY